METGRKNRKIPPQFPECDSSDLRIVLLGKSGSEISCVGNMILGRQAFKENIRESEIQRARVEDRQMSVIITPGFFNPQLTDEDLQNEMMKSLSLSHPGPHVFLLIVRPDTFRECYVKIVVQKIQENFGAQASKFTLVLLIREQMSNKEWMVLALSPKCQDLISSFRGKYHVINTENPTSTQHTTLLEKIDEVFKGNNNQHFNNNVNMKSPRSKKDEVKNENWKEIKYERESASNSFERRDEGKETVDTYIQEPESRETNEREADIRIVMVGKTGNGKSATGNTILGQDLFKAELSSASVTVDCQTHQEMVDGKWISVTDTPGLFDTSVTEDKLKSEIEKCIIMSAPGPHVFLLVLRLDVRYTEEERNTVKWIQENFSEDAMNYTMVLFTRGDQLKTSIDDYLRNNQQLEDLVQQCKAGYHVFNNQEKNQRQVIEMFRKIDRLLEENEGEHYTNEKYQEAQRKIIEERERKRQEEERKQKEEQDKIRKEEKDKIKDKVKKIALGVGAGVGVAGAVVGTVALAATPAVIIPAIAIAAGAAVSGGAGGTLVIDKVKNTILQKKKTQNTSSTTPPKAPLPPAPKTPPPKTPPPTFTRR